LEYLRLIAYDVAAKYLTSETSEKSFANPTRKSHSKKVGKNSSNYRKGSKAYFRGPGVVSDEISKNFGWRVVILGRF